MSLYAISDLHLALNGEKPMGIFGENWINHHEKIKNNWLNKITKEDTVLISGDISWAMNLEDSKVDLDWVHNLPGEKIMIKGNHDYWWGSISKLNGIYSDMHFIQNNFFPWRDYAICGTRGWICPTNEGFTEEDQKIYLREINRMELSIKSALLAGFNKIIFMLHYPPVNEDLEKSGFMEMLKKYNVEKVVYGHIHGPFQGKELKGYVEGIEYLFTSCDYLDFNPILIVE